MEKLWDESAKAYRNCLNLETDSFECWNNLSRCHMELGDKDKAWRCLNECLRWAYDDYNVWENYMLVSFQTGRVRDVLRSVERLLDLKKTKKLLGEDVLMIEFIVDLVLDGAKSPDSGNERKFC